ncbi:hypothetical protein A0H81_06461 [Grifola frondosa]|uniref:Uncharacterized protein n=1 Tax=Grifola frondosa TaxID=5627 RepID=A0A1C7MCI6_GRIFR|nr:hypothetical protein A0H81_06461 [Grifola frondosa]
MSAFELDTIYDHTTWPLESIPGRLQVLDLCFRRYSADGTSANHLWSCATSLKPPEDILGVSGVDALLLYFKVVGQVAREACYLTAQGVESWVRDFYDEEQHFASCWLEACPNYLSQVEWRKAAVAIDIVSAAAAEPLDLSRVICTDPINGAVKLRIQFTLPTGKRLENTLPIFDRTLLTRQVPSSVSEVPFDCTVCALFTLDYKCQYDTNYLLANLVSLSDL